MLEELRIPYPSAYGPLPGQNLLGAPGGGLAAGRGDYVIDYGSGSRRWVAVRSRTHKYALFACDGGREELYDLRADPDERTDLSAEQPALTAACGSGRWSGSARRGWRRHRARPPRSAAPAGAPFRRPQRCRTRTNCAAWW